MISQRGRHARKPHGAAAADGGATRRPFAVLVLCLGFALALVCWAATNPPGASPDERFHYVKALGTADGQLLGSPGPAPAPGATIQQRFLTDTARVFRLPANLAPGPRWGCEAFSQQSASCLNGTSVPPVPGSVGVSTYVALYPPVSYLAYGEAARLGTTPDEALYFGRFLGAALAAILLGLAAWSCRARWEVVGLLVAASPMVLFLGGSLNPSGLEVAAGVAHAAAVVGLIRGVSTRRAWVVYGLSGVALALARQLGPVEICFDAAVVLAMVGGRRMKAVIDADRPAAAVAIGAVGLAALGTAGWDLLAPSYAPATHASLGSSLAPAAESLWAARGQLFGLFGWLDTAPPHWATALALVVYAGLVGGALLVGTWRQRVVLAGTLVATVVYALALDLTTQIPAGFSLQWRYVMPLTAMVALLAGWILAERPRRRRAAGDSDLTARAAGAVLVALGAVAWWANAHQAAVGRTGRRLFFLSPAWSPPGGWVVWIVLFAVATGLLLAGVIGGRTRLAERRRSER